MLGFVTEMMYACEAPFNLAEGGVYVAGGYVEELHLAQKPR